MTLDAWGRRDVTLHTVIRSAAELIHPKSHIGNYPILAKFPQLKFIAHQLVTAQQAGESTAVLQDMGWHLLEVMRAAEAAKPTPDKFVRPASEVTHRPQQIRAREQELHDLRQKALKTKPKAKAEPMAALFDLPMKPPRAVTRKPNPTAELTARAFFERN